MEQPLPKKAPPKRRRNNPQQFLEEIFIAHKDGEKGELLQGETGDISAGGMLLLSSQDMEKDQKIEVEIKLPDSDSIFCQAHVVRVLGKASEEGSNNKYAIEYDDINEGQRDRIFRFIFDKQREWLRKGVTE